MITHDELSKALYEAWCKKLVYGTAVEFEDWDELGATYKAAWSAVADAAWELVEGENAEFAVYNANKLEDLRGAVVEFMNRVEDIIG
jgi:hypothetical protein